MVGYGPRPNECAALLQERTDVCLAGNHDLVVLGKIPIAAFAGDARRRARWTQSVLDDAALGVPRLAPAEAGTPGAELFHGSPLDPVWDYVLGGRGRGGASRDQAPLVLVGHSHVALELSNDESGLRGEHGARGTRSSSPAAAAPQPRLGRPAPRRRPAGRLAGD